MQSAGGRGQDFSALQQHIDELTTAKFELQRGLAQQGKLAASLAAENMRLSEDYNQQVATCAILMPSLLRSANFPAWHCYARCISSSHVCDGQFG